LFKNRIIYLALIASIYLALVIYNAKSFNIKMKNYFLNLFINTRLCETLVKENTSDVGILYILSNIFTEVLRIYELHKRSILHLLNHFVTVVCKNPQRCMPLGATKLLLPTY